MLVSRRTALVSAVNSAVIAGSVVATTSSASAAPVTRPKAPVPGNAPKPPAPKGGWTTLKQGMQGAAVTAVQTRLNSLGYWVGKPTGYYGSQTAQAVMALQKVAGLTRDGALGPQTKAALDRGVLPTPRSTSGHVLEVDKARQVLIVADNGRTTRVFNVSTGGEYRYRNAGGWATAHTPTGSWTIYRSVNTWETGPLGRMYRSQYIVGGIAIHGVGSPSGVGAYGASHGCVRTTMASQDELLRSGALRKGTRVTIY